MALINHAKREINAKIVYVGPASVGKATNLNYVYSKLKEAFRGTFKSMWLQNDRMLFFDFTPSGQGSLNGYNVRFHIYTVTGEITHPSSWKMVLKGADGLLFVTDSAPDRMTANLESLQGVEAALSPYGKTLNDIPCVIQCNKRDFPQALDIEEMGRALNPGNFPLYQAVASKGEGVLESLFTLVKMVLKNLRASGLELEGEPDQLRRMAEPGTAERAEAPTAVEAPCGVGEEAEPGAPAGATAPHEQGIAEEPPATSGDELVVEIAGEAEVLDRGGVRLPLSISYCGKVKRMKLDISLSLSDD